MDVTVIVAVVLTLMSARDVSGSTCSTYANGCSIPRDLDYFFKDKFTNDCNKHDVCYNCAVSRGWDKLTCDIRFYNNMLRTCGSHLWCKAVAYDYYFAVFYFGESHFKKSSPSWCSQSWVNSCM